jgi:hypothetical protein
MSLNSFASATASVIVTPRSRHPCQDYVQTFDTLKFEIDARLSAFRLHFDANALGSPCEGRQHVDCFGTIVADIELPVRVEVADGIGQESHGDHIRSVPALPELDHLAAREDFSPGRNHDRFVRRPQISSFAERLVEAFAVLGFLEAVLRDDIVEVVA